MKFKDVHSESYSRKIGMEIVCINNRGMSHRLTQGRVYIYTGCSTANNEDWFVIDDSGSDHHFSKFRFRKVSDLITESNTKEDELNGEINKLKEKIKEKDVEINRLERENALLVRINDLEKILKKAK